VKEFKNELEKRLPSRKRFLTSSWGKGYVSFFFSSFKFTTML